jgi:hypothetical protein
LIGIESVMHCLSFLVFYPPIHPCPSPPSHPSLETNTIELHFTIAAKQKPQNKKNNNKLT